MTRTGLSPRLSAHLSEPFLEIHPGDAARLGIAEAALVEMASPEGRAISRARMSPWSKIAGAAWRESGPLVVALFVSPEPVAVMRNYLATLPDVADQRLLSGRAPADVPDAGPILCS